MADAGPATMVTPNQQHIFLKDPKGEIQHILWDARTRKFFHDNWTQTTGAVPGAGRPVTMMTRV